MSGEKFLLDLTGRPLDGYRTEDVSVDLARLLHIPQITARNLLRGKPSRIKRELEKEKALHLMGKIIACGAQCEMSPCENQEESDQAIEAGADPSAKLELEPEIEPSEMQLELVSVVTAETETHSETDAKQDERNPAEFEVHAPEPEPPVDVLPAHGVNRNQLTPAKSAKAAGEDISKSSSSAGGRRQRVLSLAAIAALLLGFAIWAGLSFLGGSTPEPAQDVVAEPPTRAAPPEALSEMAKTRQRLDLLARSVRIWMIQYGAGFDPSQVTMARMQQDLGISPKEMEDGWGVTFRYKTTSGSYTIISAGPDQIFGNEDDLKLEKKTQ